MPGSTALAPIATPAMIEPTPSKEEAWPEAAFPAPYAAGPTG
jgi:hypothetical protein